MAKSRGKGLRVWSYYGAKCSVKGCDALAEAKEMCGKHYMRMRRYGDPNYVTPEKKRRELSRDAQLKNVKDVKPTTYRKFMGRHEHRVVAEKMLGRKLKRGEVVHHKDDNRHNNHPSNLQVMTQSEHIELHRKQMEAARAAALSK